MLLFLDTGKEREKEKEIRRLYHLSLCVDVCLCRSVEI